ncbi:MAG: hypothetical protein QOJ65_2581 [Fimbriimonadaceae bacterium]|jgi:hypothetical protein|nr:hypothetical protein [Fimbriimonadaceae bacterium]
MVEPKIQKAYNYAYGGLKGACRMLPMIANLKGNSEPGISGDARRYVEKYRDYLRQCSEQLRRIYRLEGGKSLQAAADLILEAVALWSDDSSNVQKVTAKLRLAKDELDVRSPIRYRSWIFSPWLYPKKLD